MPMPNLLDAMGKDTQTALRQSRCPYVHTIHRTALESLAIRVTSCLTTRWTSQADGVRDSGPDQRDDGNGTGGLGLMVCEERVALLERGPRPLQFLAPGRGGDRVVGVVPDLHAHEGIRHQ